MTSSSREKHRTTVCRTALALLLVAATPATGQQSDTSRSAPPSFGRYSVDVGAATRNGTALTLTDVLISQVPGLLVVPGSGLNGAGASVRFAGVRSVFADAPPLIFLDGARIDAREDDSALLQGGAGPSRLNDIPLEDVQSIEVLRGPASAAIYGPGGAAGVILIRTKEGRTGPVRLEGFAQGAVRATPSHWPANYGGVDADNANAFLRNRCNLASQAAGMCVQDFVQRFNPLVERNPFAGAPHRQLGLSATVGPSWGAFRVSGTFDGDDVAYSVPTVTWGDDYHRWNLRLSGTLHPLRNVDVLASVARVSSRLRLPMYAPVQNAVVGTSDSTGFTWASYFQDPGTQDMDRTQVGVDVRARPFAWLGLHALLGRDDVEHRELHVIPGQVRTNGGRKSAQHTLGFNATASNLALLGMRFTTTLGVERLVDRDDSRLLQIQPDTITSCGLGSPVPCSMMSQQTWRRMNSTGVYAVEQIGIRDRVFVTGMLRHDGFDDHDSWSATNPSLAVDWIARRDRLNGLGRLAFHVGYGKASQPPPALIETFIVAPFPFTAPSVEPERTREVEIGAEATGLGGRWRLQASVYDLRSDVLAYGLVPTLGGAAAMYVPGSVITNRGATAMMSATLIDRAAWAWDLRLSIWGNRNRLVKLVTPPTLYGFGTTWTGQGEFEGYPANGYWSWPLLGFSDANGDGIITSSEVVVSQNVTWAGSPYPTQGAALSSAWRFAKRWRLSTTLDYRAGQVLFNQTANLRCQYGVCRERNDPATPLPAQALAIAAYGHPLAYYEDGDYLKLRELAISFDVPERAASTLGARGATIMIGGRDLVTWTRYSGADPETGSYGRRPAGTPTMIADFATIPVLPSWTLRVRVSY